MELSKDITEVNPVDTAMSITWSEYAARAVSGLSTPPLLAMEGIILSANTLSQDSVWFWVFVYSLISVITPTLYVFRLVRTGRVKDFHINRREERMRPLLVVLATSVAALIVLLAGKAPTLLILLAACGTVQIFLIFVITSRWKISAHSAAAGGVSVLSVMLFGESAIPLLFAIPLVAWSRIRLERHTAFQTAAGAFLGAMTIALALLFYKNWMAIGQLATGY